MITKTESLVVSDHILNLILSDERSSEIRAYVIPYNNGREHGYSIVGTGNSYDKMVTFSQDRMSDQIVIYSGSCPMSGNLSEEAYQSRKYFKNNRYLEVVSYILDRCKFLFKD